MKPERRFIPAEKSELRMDEEGEERRLTHHSPPWDTLSVPLWHEWVGDRLVPIREQFRRGAFGDLVNGDVVALRDHKSSRVLGRTTSGTLELEEDDIGLRYEVLLPNTSDGRDIAELVGRGDVNGSSFSFRVGEDGEEDWDYVDANGNSTTELDLVETIVRTVIRVTYLGDTGPVTFPAYRFDEEVDLRSSGHCSDAVSSYTSWRQAKPVVKMGNPQEDPETIRRRYRQMRSIA